MLRFRVEVLKPFSYSHDGTTILQAAAGSLVDLNEDLLPGLMREGFVGRETPLITINEARARAGIALPSERPPMPADPLAKISQPNAGFLTPKLPTKKASR
jgi:hypothetical protein